MRIGQGFDVHAFGMGNHVMLAGVQVPHSHGVVAHSDGDVVIHALCDAIFGALALGDIGRHFPSTDASWRNADSRRFLRHAALLTAKHGYALGNADITVISEAPRIGPYIRVMRENLAADLGSQVARISIKATTTDKLGFSGRGEGIAAMACVLLDHY